MKAMETTKTTTQLHFISKEEFQGCFDAVIGLLNVEETILKKNNVSFIVHFCLRKYFYSFDFYWIHQVTNYSLELHISKWNTYWSNTYCMKENMSDIAISLQNFYK